MLVRRLQTRGVFCCHCQISEQSIVVGILVSQGVTGEVNLLDPETQAYYQTRIPPISKCEYNVTLPRIRLQQPV